MIINNSLLRPKCSGSGLGRNESVKRAEKGRTLRSCDPAIPSNRRIAGHGPFYFYFSLTLLLIIFTLIIENVTIIIVINNI